MKLQTENLPKFECKISNQKLTQLLDIARNSQFDSFNFHVTEKGFKFNQMDSSHVSLIQGRIDLKSFEDYSLKIKGSFVFIESDLKNTLKIFGKKDILNITCDIEPKIIFSSKDITVEYRIFNLFSNETFKAPKLYYDTEFDIIEKTKLYNNLVKVAKTDDYIIFHIVNPLKKIPSRVNFILKNNGDKNPIQRVTFTTPTEFYHHPDNSFKIAFHLEYLIDFIKYLPKEKIFLRMAKGMPLLIKAYLDENSYVYYWLAPRIQDNPKEFE